MGTAGSHEGRGVVVRGSVTVKRGSHCEDSEEAWGGRSKEGNYGKSGELQRGGAIVR